MMYRKIPETDESLFKQQNIHQTDSIDDNPFHMHLGQNESMTNQNNNNIGIKPYTEVQIDTNSLNMAKNKYNQKDQHQFSSPSFPHKAKRQQYYPNFASNHNRNKFVILIYGLVLLITIIYCQITWTVFLDQYKTAIMAGNGEIIAKQQAKSINFEKIQWLMLYHHYKYHSNKYPGWSRYQDIVNTSKSDKYRNKNLNKDNEGQKQQKKQQQITQTKTQIIKTVSLSVYIDRLRKLIKKPVKYIDVDKYQQKIKTLTTQNPKAHPNPNSPINRTTHQNQLPICLIVNPSHTLTPTPTPVPTSTKFSQIVDSIAQNNYTNRIIVVTDGHEHRYEGRYRHVYREEVFERGEKFRRFESFSMNYMGKGEQSGDQREFLKVHGNWLRVVKVEEKGLYGYQLLKQLILNVCPVNNLITIVSQPITNDFLKNINYIHQTYNVWLTHSITYTPSHQTPTPQIQQLQIHTFYPRIFQLLFLNPPTPTSTPTPTPLHLHPQTLTLSMLELTAHHTLQLQKSPYKDPNVKPLFTAHRNTQLRVDQGGDRVPYNVLSRLSEEVYVDKFEDGVREKLMVEEMEVNEGIVGKLRGLSVEKMRKAIQYQDLIYLPWNHFLAYREYYQYDQRYGISQLNQQTPTTSPPPHLCLTILSHNNTPQSRHKKSLLSILQQQYHNYHIVFIDDLSTDQNLNETIALAREMGFPPERITFIRNNVRLYASYNILNAGYGFCGSGDVQVVVDGDDQLVGRQVLGVLARGYVDGVWMVYTNLKTNLYQFGTSTPLTPQNTYIDKNKKRVKGHWMGQLRSWRVSLLRKIPKFYFQTQVGNWLDTLYDDALQHSLFQLSTPPRILYLPQICYQYNRQYGDNDDSNSQKQIYRYVAAGSGASGIAGRELRIN